MLSKLLTKLNPPSRYLNPFRIINPPTEINWTLYIYHINANDMIQVEHLKKNLPYIVGMMFVILLVYAASNKLMDYQRFKVQLGQSPILTAYADTVAWMVPVSELGLSVLLLFERYRLFALYACFGLMTMFTTYILLILNFSDFIPCSCGGVLENLNWTEHVVFNLFFIGIALIAILVIERDRIYKTEGA